MLTIPRLVYSKAKDFPEINVNIDPRGIGPTIYYIIITETSTVGGVWHIAGKSFLPRQD